ncbi:MAG TPA: shikimate kinase [Hyphomicrobiales bacterium]|nr:shikimate kinase [Hyphomicrobiales bacterium]
MDNANDPRAPAGPDIARLVSALGGRSVVLIGMMGAGKSSVGRRLGRILGLPFNDVDVEIEHAAGMTIPEIFQEHGEPYFRAGESRVLSRLLAAGQQVLATGGGAWIDPANRAAIAGRGLSVWLKAEPEVLLRRLRRRTDRPLLQTADPEASLRTILAAREPVYALADLTVPSRDVAHEQVVTDLVAALDAHFAAAVHG